MSRRQRRSSTGFARHRYRLTFIGVWIIGAIVLLALLSPSGAPPEVRISDLVPPKYAGTRVKIVRAQVFLSEGSIPDIVSTQIQLPQSYVYMFAATDPLASGTILQCFSTRLFGLRINQVITIVGTLYYKTQAGLQYIPYVLVEEVQ